jgi:molybdopterin molybdotransferase
VKSFDDHAADILASVQPLAPIELQLLDAHGCIVVDEMVSRIDLPTFDNSSMDGYAVRAADVAEASEDTPVRLPVVGDIPAGSASAFTVQTGFCARIMTGAPIPPGADAVVPVEHTDGGVVTVSITTAAQPGDRIRQRGDDVTAGEVLLKAGRYLGPAQVGLLAAAGYDRARVRPSPRVVVLSTGSELVEPGQTPGAGQIFDANSYLLTAAARDAGATVYPVGIVPDDTTRLRATIEDQLIRADLVITSGGVSVGAYDVVKEVLSQIGTVHFDKVAMQPGMPQGFGVLGPEDTPIVTLPGNPVSAFVSFEVFVRPAIRKMIGLVPWERPMVRATSLEKLTSSVGKRQFLRAQLSWTEGRYVVSQVGGTGSHLLADLAHANALIVIPESVTEIPRRGSVDVMVLERRYGT